MSIFNEIFRTDGRLNRLRYLKYMILLALVAGISTFVMSSMLTFFTGNHESPAVMLVTLMWALIAGAGNVMLMIRRLHDLGKNGMFWLVAIIPVIGLIFSIYLFCAPGQSGWNEYGADPLADED
ncbi:MAG: DUF805 domain-containing protein [Selenomonadaceae bacterium]|nr:DUF805 domain-containing protein [Selenomonadaceae bacterium]